MDVFIVWDWKKSPFIQQKHIEVLQMCAPFCVTGQRVAAQPPPPHPRLGWEVLKQKLISTFMSSSAHFTFQSSEQTRTVISALTPKSKKKNKTTTHHKCQQTTLLGLFSGACHPSIWAHGVRGRLRHGGPFSTFVTKFFSGSNSFGSGAVSIPVMHPQISPPGGRTVLTDGC